MDNFKIADTDGTDSSGSFQPLQFFPGSGIAAGYGPVDQIQVYIIQTEPVQTPLEGSGYVSDTLRVIPDLGGDK